jgi:hypothetical protein
MLQKSAFPKTDDVKREGTKRCCTEASLELCHVLLIDGLSRTNCITPKSQDFTPLDFSTSIYKKYRIHAEKMRDFCDRKWDTNVGIVSPVILQ